MSVPGPASTAPAPLRIAIAGASGRMGRMLVEAILEAPDCTLAGALDVAGSAQLGQDAGAFLGRATGVAIIADVDAALEIGRASCRERVSPYV